MSLTAKESSGQTIDPIPEGVYVAVCYGVIDLGVQYSKFYQKSTHKIMIMWEVPEVRIEVEKDGKKQDLPRVISKRYTLSLSTKASLRKELEAWRGRKFTAEELAGFDLKNLLGKACQLQIVHSPQDDKIYANVSAIMSIPKGLPVPKSSLVHMFFSFEEGGEIPKDCPEWVVKTIQQSEEWAAKTGKPLPPVTVNVGGQEIDMSDTPF